MRSAAIRRRALGALLDLRRRLVPVTHALRDGMGGGTRCDVKPESARVVDLEALVALLFAPVECSECGWSGAAGNAKPSPWEAPTALLCPHCEAPVSSEEENS